MASSPAVDRSLGPAGLFVQPAKELRRLTLRFRDPALETRFQAAYFRDNLPYIRLAHVIGIAVWAAFGLLAANVLEEGQSADVLLRFGVGVPIALLSLLLTFAPWYERVWQPLVSAVLLGSGFAWSIHRWFVTDARPDWGYAGLMVVLAFVYILARIQFRYAALVGAALVIFHNLVAAFMIGDTRLELLFADYFLIVFASIGMAASYGLERFTRLLFLRELELDRERARVDELLGNTLPRAIVDRLKAAERSEDRAIADGLDAVSILFADLEGFTDHSQRIRPEQVVALLDEVFRRFDAEAAELGLEKIKTIGDAYMVAAGAPEPRGDHAAAAAEMGLRILDVIASFTWPTGDPLQIRVGIASGPVVAGVIGRHRFAYDLWGDTVNLASRLEANGQPGRVLVSEETYRLLGDRFVFADPCTLDLKGRGPTAAHYLVGRS
jgi:class 3 adenylate cyclase